MSDGRVSLSIYLPKNFNISFYPIEINQIAFTLVISICCRKAYTIKQFKSSKSLHIWCLSDSHHILPFLMHDIYFSRVHTQIQKRTHPESFILMIKRLRLLFRVCVWESCGKRVHSGLVCKCERVSVLWTFSSSRKFQTWPTYLQRPLKKERRRERERGSWALDWCSTLQLHEVDERHCEGPVSLRWDASISPFLLFTLSEIFVSNCFILFHLIKSIFIIVKKKYAQKMLNWYIQRYKKSIVF